METDKHIQTLVQINLIFSLNVNKKISSNKQGWKNLQSEKKRKFAGATTVKWRTHDDRRKMCSVFEWRPTTEAHAKVRFGMRSLFSISVLFLLLIISIVWVHITSLVGMLYVMLRVWVLCCDVSWGSKNGENAMLCWYLWWWSMMMVVVVLKIVVVWFW